MRTLTQELKLKIESELDDVMSPFTCFIIEREDWAPGFWVGLENCFITTSQGNEYVIKHIDYENRMLSVVELASSAFSYEANTHIIKISCGS